MAEGIKVAGFRAHCYNRNAIRSFRYDRIASINKI
jgi:predicted DNA-binding transcriptional regulator YafY